MRYQRVRTQQIGTWSGRTDPVPTDTSLAYQPPKLVAGNGDYRSMSGHAVVLRALNAEGQEVPSITFNWTMWEVLESCDGVFFTSLEPKESTPSGRKQLSEAFGPLLVQVTAMTDPDNLATSFEVYIGTDL